MNPEDLLRIVFALGLEHKIKLVHPYYHFWISFSNSASQFNYDLLLIYAEKHALTHANQQSALYIRIPVDCGTINSSVITSPEAVADALGLARTNSNDGQISIRAIWNPLDFIASERCIIAYEIFKEAFYSKIESQQQQCLDNGVVEHSVTLRQHF